MAKDPQPPHSPSEEFEDAFEDEEFEKQFSEGDDDALFEGEDEDFESFEDFELEETQHEMPPLPEVPHKEIAPLPSAHKQEEPKAPENAASPGQPTLAVQKTDVQVKIEDLPLSLIVEAGRVKMTFRELRDLSPGNVLDLKLNPEQGVDLVVGGKKIGKGELLKVGETLGIRILEIYSH